MREKREEKREREREREREKVRKREWGGGERTSESDTSALTRNLLRHV
jgi:hypothetical protein